MQARAMSDKPIIVQMTIRMPIELRDATRKKSRREDLSASQVVRRLLREWLADDLPQRKEEGKGKK